MEKIIKNTGRLFLIVAVNMAVIWFANWIIIKGFNWLVNLHWMLVLVLTTILLGCFEIVIFSNHLLLKRAIRNTKPSQLLLPVILLLLIFAVHNTKHLWQHEPELIYWYEKYAYYAALLASFLCWFAPISIYNINSEKSAIQTDTKNSLKSNVILHETDKSINADSESPSKMLVKARQLFNEPNLSSDELVELVQSGSFSYEHKADPLDSRDVSIYYNPSWMGSHSLAMLFMVEVPNKLVLKDRHQALLYLPERIQRLIIQARMDNEKPEHFIEDILDIPLHYFTSEPATKELVQIILNSGQFATWKYKFLNDELENDEEFTSEDAFEIFETTTLYQYLQELSNC